MLRAERGLTLRDAERLTGVDKDTLSKIERGRRHPHDVTLAKIAKGYGLPVEELLGEPVPLGDAPPPGRAAKKAAAKRTRFIEGFIEELQRANETPRESVFDIARELREAIVRQGRREEQAFARAAESEDFQVVNMDAENEAEAQLRQLPPDMLADLCVYLMKNQVQLERENEALRDRPQVRQE